MTDEQFKLFMDGLLGKLGEMTDKIGNLEKKMDGIWDPEKLKTSTKDPEKLPQLAIVQPTDSTKANLTEPWPPGSSVPRPKLQSPGKPT